MVHFFCREAEVSTLREKVLYIVLIFLFFIFLTIPKTQIGRNTLIFTTFQASAVESCDIQMMLLLCRSWCFVLKRRARERERGAVCRWALALFSMLSNPHVKLFPALHRKLPSKGPTVTASAGTSGNAGAVSMGRRVGGGCKLCEGGGFRAAGQLWRSQSPHISSTQMFTPSCITRSVIHISHLLFCCKICVTEKKV